MFRHNDAPHLEAILRVAIAEGQPRTHRPWRKVRWVPLGLREVFRMRVPPHRLLWDMQTVVAQDVAEDSDAQCLILDTSCLVGFPQILVVLEGVYSMEGEICKLKPVVAVCKKYKVGMLTGLRHPFVCSATYLGAVRAASVQSKGALGQAARAISQHENDSSPCCRM